MFSQIYGFFNGLLGLGQTDSTAAVQALIVSLKDPNAIIREEAIIALSQLPAYAKPAVPALLRLLRDEKYDPATTYALRRLPSRAGGIHYTIPTNFFTSTPTVQLISSGYVVADLAAGALWQIDAEAARTAGLKEPR